MDIRGSESTGNAQRSLCLHGVRGDDDEDIIGVQSRKVVYNFMFFYRCLNERVIYT